MKMTFDQYDRQKPLVGDFFKRFTLDVIRAGHYKINNNFAPDFARKFMREFPHYNHFFELRRQHNGNTQ